MATGTKVTQVKLDGKDITSDYFDGFNWHAFKYNDIVYLEDCDETPLLKGRFITHAVEQNKSIVYIYR